ncbi:vWA domain-containing protein [Nitratifractor salsuginis]|uniref:von Willebrand factor type A n=1 Tax=Nitratifractor salsuginis (strain DSM 16511 / JCM 12458 / E9I37-1) TaxID=749222 RepID=E6WZG6_NITSE|nr:VWA domain-containing protein [Nitratifractor salsuginis]ADV45546.1 von Willebrand factor type A [Nitratifractor salsuginis DSM 16511]
MNQFSFQYPWALALILLFWICGRYCPARTQAIYFPHVRRLLSVHAHKSRWLEILKWIGIISLLLALASPVLTNEYKEIKKKGRDIMLVIDSSDSMNQWGFDPGDPNKSKFDVVKEVVGDFIDKRKNDRIGLINFASVAFVASPLTFEKDFLRKILQMQEPGIAGKRTAINDALLQTYNILSKSDAKSKIAILLTDGIDNASRISFDEIRRLISDSDIKLYTIGIGSYRDFDAPYLKALAQAGHGRFFAASDRRSLQKIYEAIDRLETSKIKSKRVVQHRYLYIYPLFVAILAWLFFIYLRSAKGVE